MLEEEFGNENDHVQGNPDMRIVDGAFHENLKKTYNFPGAIRKAISQNIRAEDTSSESLRSKFGASGAA